MRLTLPSVTGALCAGLIFLGGGSAVAQETFSSSAPAMRVDPFWPKPLPSNWLIGQIGGISVDAQGRIWVLNRPGSHTPDEVGATQDPPRSICCTAAPAVLVFNAEGDLLQSWTGEARGDRWPNTEHSIFVDHLGFVWIGGAGENDGFVVKYTADGRFVSRIGSPGPSLGNADTTRLGRPAGLFVDPERNELYVADGYANQRIIVFDAETGAYRRHWGAYGRPPVDTGQAAATPGNYPPTSGPAHFALPHGLRISEDGKVYVADRPNNRIQIFDRSGAFLSEQAYLPATQGLGSTWDLAFTPDSDQSLVVVADGENNQLHFARRADGQIVGSVGRRGRNAGQFHWLHAVAVDGAGAVYTGEVQTGKRLQRFVPESAQ